MTTPAHPAESGSFRSSDGVTLAWREIGAGRPLILLHGLFSNAELNWAHWGTAGVLADDGHRVILPDFRGHGTSGAPRDPSSYPPDVLARDVEELVHHLGLDDLDLGGYSLGARTAIRLVVRGMRPAHLVLGGMGLEGIVGSDERKRFFLRVLEMRDSARAGTPEWLAAQFMKSNGIDAEAARHLLGSLVQTSRTELATVRVPTLVICGSDDRDNGSPEALAGALQDARFVEIPGNHLTAATRPELGRAIVAFLATRA